jgi:hypothetical protein
VKHVLALLLKDQRLNFLPYFFIGPELLRFFVVEPDDVKAV